MLGRNHKIVNGISLFPIISCLNRYYKKEVLDLLPDDKVILVSLIFTCLFTYFYAATLPDIDNKKWIPFRHRTWLHSVWGLLFIGYFSYKHREVYPFIFFVSHSFILSYFLHLFFDDFSIMGCDLFYPLIGYREYHGGRVKYRNGPFHFEFYKTGDESERRFVIGVCIILIIITLLINFPYLVKLVKSFKLWTV